MIRLNIIFVILKLLYFLINPSLIYMQMVNKVIHYLLNIRILRFKFGEKNKLEIITDTSFIVMNSRWVRGWSPDKGKPRPPLSIINLSKGFFSLLSPSLSMAQF